MMSQHLQVPHRSLTESFLTPYSTQSGVDKLFECKLKISGRSSSRYHELDQLHNKVVHVWCHPQAIHFEAVDDDAFRVALPFSDVQSLGESHGIMWLRPAVNFTTYHGHRCKLKNFADRPTMHAFSRKIHNAFNIGHSRRSLSKMNVMPADNFTSTSSVPVFGSARQGTAPASPIEIEREDSNASTIPPGEVHVCAPLLLPEKSDFSPVPTRPADQKWSPGASFTLEDCTVDLFFKLFFSDGASGCFDEEGGEVTSLTKWTTAQEHACSRRVRVAKALTGLPKSFGPESIRCTQHEWVTQQPNAENGGVMICEFAGRGHDLPVISHFDILQRWTITPFVDRPAIRVTSEQAVHYHKHFTVTKAVRGLIVAKARETSFLFAQHAKAFLVEYLRTRIDDGKNQEDSVVVVKSIPCTAVHDTSDTSDVNTTASVQGSTGFRENVSELPTPAALVQQHMFEKCNQTGTVC